MEYLRRKRCGLPVSACKAGSPESVAISKDEYRRKRNRESAERSRQKKIALLDFWTVQNCELFVALQDLTEENLRLKQICELPKDVYFGSNCYGTSSIASGSTSSESNTSCSSPDVSMSSYSGDNGSNEPFIDLTDYDFSDIDFSNFL